MSTRTSTATKTSLSATPKDEVSSLHSLERAELQLLMEELAALPDPRQSASITYPLQSLLLIALCTILTGKIAFTDMSLYAELHHPFLSNLLGREAPRPSHDTFRYLFSILDPEPLHEMLHRWDITLPKDHRQTPQVAIDGKSKRMGKGSGGGKPLLHTVGAILRQRGLTLSAKFVPEKGGEIQAIRETIHSIHLAGCVVTIDAGGTFRDVADAIVEKKADYILALKMNQEKLYRSVELAFSNRNLAEIKHDFTETNHGHGRTEIRHIQMMNSHEVNLVGEPWRGLHQVIRVERIRSVGKAAPTLELAYYISSWEGGAKEHAEMIRGHWSIENQLHWILDANWMEDRHHLRSVQALKNLGLLTRFGLNLLKLHPRKDSLRRKMLAASYSTDFIVECLAQIDA